jgi:hypothetical protein
MQLPGGHFQIGARAHSSMMIEAGYCNFLKKYCLELYFYNYLTLTEPNFTIILRAIKQVARLLLSTCLLINIINVKNTNGPDFIALLLLLLLRLLLLLLRLLL